MFSKNNMKAKIKSLKEQLPYVPHYNDRYMEYLNSISKEKIELKHKNFVHSVIDTLNGIPITIDYYKRINEELQFYIIMYKETYDEDYYNFSDDYYLPRQ